MLAIETSSTRCEVALALDDRVQALARLPEQSKPTATLVPTMRDLCRSIGWQPRELKLICVDIGPGSYTGLRVGLTCAKTLAFAAGAELAPVRSLDAVAWNVPRAAEEMIPPTLPGEVGRTATEQLVEVAFDAARGQVFACRFRRTAECWVACDEIRIMHATDWVRALDPAAVVTGPALVKYRTLIPPQFRVADESRWWPRAEQLIELGLQRSRAAPAEPYWTLEPLYLRPSAAEEKRSARLP